MYPNDGIDKFIEKLNKLDGNTYVIEEEVTLINGVYEGELEHDNISIPSISVYTGMKLTGDRVVNFIISTPSLTPWKSSIKIFASVDKVYITYETQGDTVEAEDINKAQDSIVNTQTEVNRYKGVNDSKVSNIDERLIVTENNKAEKTYVDTELLKKYDKERVYTKEEVLQKIQDLIGTAPQALDTFKEIADALGSDPNFATTITNLLGNKVDKVAGKQLSAEDYTTTEKTKLAGVQDNANDYVHPSSHPATMIIEDSVHKWTTDDEKSNWNDANSKKHTHNNLSLLEAITQSVVDAWNSAVNHISDVVKHITSDERNLWNTVINKADTGHKHAKVDITDFPTKVSQFTNDSNYVNQSQLGNAGYGDMLKATYDKDGNGIIDNADNLTNFKVGSRSTADVNTYLTSGTYALEGAPANSPVTYGSVIVANNIDTTLQIAGGYQSDNLYFRGSWNNGGGFSPWRKVWHDGNFNPYSKVNKGCTWNDLKGV